MLASEPLSCQIIEAAGGKIVPSGLIDIDPTEYTPLVVEAIQYLCDEWDYYLKHDPIGD